MFSTRLLTAALLATLSTGQVVAEVSADDTSAAVNIIILGITEGPDPIPQFVWSPVRPIPVHYFLNASGARRDDGPPGVAQDPTTRTPHVVWAYDSGADHDVAYSRWDGSGWSPTEFLTVQSSDDLDPRIYVEDDGTLHVVWWESAAQRVRLLSRPPAGDWGAVETVAVGGRRPAVAVHAGQLRVAYERDLGIAGAELVIATRTGPGSFVVQTLATTAGAPAITPVLNVQQGHVWVDWTQSAAEHAYAELVDGEWTAPSIVAWVHDSWIRVEEVRKLIQRTILGD